MKPTICLKDMNDKVFGVVEDDFTEINGDEMLPRDGILALTQRTRTYFTWKVRNGK